jgi:hypothetical protein
MDQSGRVLKAEMVEGRHDVNSKLVWGPFKESQTYQWSIQVLVIAKEPDFEVGIVRLPEQRQYSWSKRSKQNIYEALTKNGEGALPIARETSRSSNKLECRRETEASAQCDGYRKTTAQDVTVSGIK